MTPVLFVQPFNDVVILLFVLFSGGRPPVQLQNGAELVVSEL